MSKMGPAIRPGPPVSHGYWGRLHLLGAGQDLLGTASSRYLEQTLYVSVASSRAGLNRSSCPPGWIARWFCNRWKPPGISSVQYTPGNHCGLIRYDGISVNAIWNAKLLHGVLQSLSPAVVGLGWQPLIAKRDILRFSCVGERTDTF